MEIHEDLKASFGARAAATIIDGIFLGIISQISQSFFSGLIGSANNSGLALVGGGLLLIANLIVLPLIYYVPSMLRSGQTLGKMILKIKVVNADLSENLTSSTILLREFVGKFFSGIVFFIGYLVFLFGKQTWHDRMAETLVIKKN